MHGHRRSALLAPIIRPTRLIFALPASSHTRTQAFADELHAREFRMPRREVQCLSHKRSVMQASGFDACVCVLLLTRASWLQCYAANGDNVLVCADAIKALVACSNSVRERALHGQLQ